jgi:hypothetical protein
LKDKEGRGIALNNLGLALLKSGNLTEAEKNLRAGIEVWESQRGRLGNNDAYKVSIFEEQARTYRLYNKSSSLRINHDAALEIAERGRARAFVELLRQGAINTSLTPTIPPSTPPSHN